MSSIATLLDTLCPDGIEYKTLGEIATSIYRGAGIKRTEVTEDGIPCVRYGEIYTTYGIWFDECVSHTHLEYVPSPKYFEYGDILFAITGESIEDIAKSTAYLGKEKCLAGEIRPVNRIEQRIQEAEKLGFRRIIIPAQQQQGLSKRFRIEVVAVGKVADAFRLLIQK